MQVKYTAKTFWRKVALPNTIGTNECWEWQGTKDKDGYGQLSYDGRLQRAHRVSYTIAVGPIPNGMQILHSCDNPPCVNPQHLRPGTPKENTQDAVIRGRMARGERQGTHTHPETVRRGEQHLKAKLTEAQVIEILAVPNGDHLQNSLSLQYGVDRCTINDIFKGRTWKHIKR